MKKFIMEFIGTFFLVLTIGFAVVKPGLGLFAPIAIGGMLMVMVYAGVHISGAHYNPAVTLGVFLRKGCSLVEVGLCTLAQVLAGIIATGVVVLFKDITLVKTAQLSLVHVAIAEVLFTFALVFVVLQVTTSAKTKGNSYFGLAIGFTVMAGAFAVGGVSGGAFNPAVALSLCLYGIVGWPYIALFLASHAVGAVAAGLLFNYLEFDKPAD